MTNGTTTPTATPTPADVPAEWIGTGTRADDKRPGAYCFRAQCVARMIERKRRGLTGTLLVRDGRLAVKHNRGKAVNRRERNVKVWERDGRACVWCGEAVTLAEAEQDRVVASCEYSQRNLVTSCKCCNNQRNQAATGDTAILFAQNDARDTERAVAAIVALATNDPEFHGAT